LQELEGGDSGLRRLCSVQTCLVMGSILKFGSPEQRSNYLPQLQQGRLLPSFSNIWILADLIKILQVNEWDTYVKY
jgi:hypothetical protein